MVKNKGVVNKHELVGTIEEKDGKAVIRGEFDKQRGGNSILIIFIIMVAVKLIFSLKAPVINTGEVVLCSAIIAFGVYACYKYKPGFSSIEKRELDALSEIFEATNVYDDKKRTKDEKNGGLW